jgi:hypothetical protein
MTDHAASANARAPSALRISLIVFAGAVALYWAVYWIALAASPLGRDVDFDDDGNVSLVEALDGATIRSQQIVIEGKQCVDYSAPKTGTRWRLECKHP